MRDSKRQRSRASRRDRIAEKGEVPDVGDVVEGYVRKVPRACCVAQYDCNKFAKKDCGIGGFRTTRARRERVTKSPSVRSESVFIPLEYQLSSFFISLASALCS